MNILIVYTHPNHTSLNYAFLQHVLNGISNNNEITEVKVTDLYEEGFDPILVFNDEKLRSDMHVDPNYKTYREQILWADKLVFIYPIWWGRPPAMLLGYFDQLFSTNFAYKYTSGLFQEKLLKGKSAICISTMKGPKNYPLFFLNNAHKALMKKALFGFVGIKDVKFFEFGSVEKSPEKQNKKLTKVHKYFSTLES